MTVQKIYTNGNLIEPGDLNNPVLLNNYCINSNANITMEDGNWSFIGNPTECSLLVAAHTCGTDYQKLRASADIVRIFPFSSQNKDMTQLLMRNGKLMLYTNGNP